VNRSVSPVLIGVLLVAASAAVLLSVFAAGFMSSQADEMVMAWAAKRVTAGDVPYRDFFCILPPLMIQGLAGFFRFAGASLGAMRLLMVAWLVGTTILLYHLFLKFKVPVLWSAAAAFQLPAFILPFWPISSHHWFALGLGLAALCAVVGPEATSHKFRWFVSGLFACLAGLCLQTDGFLFTLLVLLYLPFGQGMKCTLRTSAYFLLGVLVPLSVAALFLLSTNALGAAWESLIVWPMRYYKQPGGFNDVNPLPALLEALRSRVPEKLADAGNWDLMTFLFGLALPFAGLLSLAFSPAWLYPGSSPSSTYLRHLLRFLLVLWFYLSGRPDWVHLVFYLPLFLICAVTEINWRRETWRPTAAKALVLLLTGWALVRWPVHWIQDPPLVSRVLQADARFTRQAPVGILKALPDVTRGRLQVVYLPYGSSLYFYWAPDPPPVDWVMAPSLKHDGPEQFEKLASFLKEHAVPYVLIREDQADKFLYDPSPVSDVLQRSYKPERSTPWGILFRRLSYTPAERPLPRGKSP